MMTEIKELYPYIITSLSSMASWDTKTATEAAGFVRYMESSAFVAAFVIAENILGYTKALSLRLQGKTIYA